MAEIKFRRDFEVAHGVLEPVSPLIRRIVARNPGPFTFTGTGTYVVGRGTVAIIDPGPDIAEHIDALLGALRGETVSHILVTHTHHDHSPAAAAVKHATGAPTYGFGPHGGAASPDGTGEEGADRDFVPDHAMREGDAAEGPGWRLEAVHTPGHTSNHLCFALPEERVLFSGDHVMGWSTSVIAPPDGDMTHYLGALEKLLAPRRRRLLADPRPGDPLTARPCPRLHQSSPRAQRGDPRAAGIRRRCHPRHGRRDLCRAGPASQSRRRPLGARPSHRAGRRGTRRERRAAGHRVALPPAAAGLIPNTPRRSAGRRCGQGGHHGRGRDGDRICRARQSR